MEEGKKITQALSSLITTLVRGMVCWYLLSLVPYKAQSLQDIVSFLPLNGPWPSLASNQFWGSLKCSKANISCKRKHSELFLQSLTGILPLPLLFLTQSSYQGKAVCLCWSCTETQTPCHFPAPSHKLPHMGTSFCQTLPGPDFAHLPRKRQRGGFLLG